MMVQSPSVVSPGLSNLILLNRWTKQLIKPSALPGNPSNDFICDTAMVTAAADVKPQVTGIEINSTRNPAYKIVYSKILCIHYKYEFLTIMILNIFMYLMSCFLVVSMYLQNNNVSSCLIYILNVDFNIDGWTPTPSSYK